MPRYLSISLLRAIGIILMVQVHFGWYLTDPSDQKLLLYDFMVFLGEMPPPLFFFTLGASLVLSINKRKEAVCSHLVRRALGLVIFGLLLMPVWQGSILHYLGIHSLIAYALLKVQKFVRILFAFVLLLVTPYVLDYWDYMSGWERLGYSLADFWTVKGFVRNFFVSGFFPLFPWLFFSVIGTVIGEYLVDSVQHKTEQLVFIYSKLAGLLLLALGLVIKVFTPWDITFYPPTIGYVLLFSGFCLVIFALSFWLFDIQQLHTKKLGPFIFIGDVSLSAYILHILLGLYPVQMLQMNNSLPIEMVFIAIVVMLGIIWSVCTVSMKVLGKGPFEFLLRQIFFRNGTRKLTIE